MNLRSRYRAWILLAVIVGCTTSCSLRLSLPHTGLYDYGPAWSPNGQAIAFVCYRPTFSVKTDSTRLLKSPDYSGDIPRAPQGFEICSMAPDGTRRRELTHNDAEDYAPLWSPDGSQIAFVSNRDGGLGLYIMNADGSQQHRLTNKEGHADWSSDGKNIAIADGGIYVLDLTTGGEQLLVQGEADHPTWSPDGKLMAFVIQTQGECQMHVIRIGAGVEIVPPVASDCTKPAWAPDSSRLAFALRSAKHGPAGRLFVLDVRTRGNLILTDEHQWLGDGLVWSLLGSQIFYPADGEIFVAQADGRGQSQLTSLGRSLLAFVNVHNLALSPDGKRIVFARNEDKNNTADNARLWIINTDGSGSRKLSP